MIKNGTTARIMIDMLEVCSIILLVAVIATGCWVAFEVVALIKTKRKLARFQREHPLNP